MLGYAFYQRENNLYPIPQAAVDRAVAHAMDCWPDESCGVVYGVDYIPIVNCADDPGNNFKLNPIQYRHLFLERGEPDAVIHSHPRGQHYPSKEDQESQILCGLTYGLIVMGGPRQIHNVIFWGDKMPLAPALGRPFVYGIYDCWATARDMFYRDFGVRLNNYARNDTLLDPKAPDNYFMDHFEDCGFHQIDFTELRRGDICLSRIWRTDKVNHCGYYMGDGSVIHHPFGTPHRPSLSQRDIIYRWKNFITHCMRYKEDLPFVQAPAPTQEII